MHPSRLSRAALDEGTRTTIKGEAVAAPRTTDDLAAVGQGREIRRVVFSSFVGSALEFYDFLLYGVAASLVFGPVFFTDLSPELATIASLVTFAAGYIARPLGGVVFGHFGDRLGRKRMLVLSLVCMGGASSLIGLVPPASSIGAWGAIILLTLRLLQGIAIGGEWGGAALMALEHARPERRGFMAAFVNAGAPAGGILGTLVMATFAAVLTDEQFLSWGWRIPFVLSILLTLIGLYARMKIAESPLFELAQTQGASDAKRAPLPIVEVLRRPRTVLVVTFACIASFTMQATITVFGLTYAVDQGSSRSEVLYGFTIGQAFAIVGILFYAKLSDRLGRRPVMIFGCLASVAVIYPMFALLRVGGLLGSVAAFLLFCVAQNAIFGPMAAFISEQFGTRSRYTGASVGYQLASLIGGGFTPAILAALYAATNKSAVPVMIFTAAVALLSAAALRLAPETRSRAIDE